MAYTMYMDGVAMPITPSKVEMKIENQNKTLNLIDGTSSNIIGGISKVILPHAAAQIKARSRPHAVSAGEVEHTGNFVVNAFTEIIP